VFPEFPVGAGHGLHGLHGLHVEARDVHGFVDPTWVDEPQDQVVNPKSRDTSEYN